MTDLARLWIAVWLTWIAGYVDAVGYITYSRTYTANMSGNTVALGLRIAEGRFDRAARRGWPILVFVCGMVLSALIGDAAIRRGIRSRCSITLGLELILLAAFGLLANGSFFLLTGLLALAMGVQNATLSRAGPLTVRTTHVTGMLAEFADLVAAFAVRGVGPPRGAPHGSALALFSVWVAFTVGAMSGALANARLGIACVVPPCLALLALVGLDLRRPISPPQRTAAER